MVTYESTPNPDTMKYLMGRHISHENLQFDNPVSAIRSPLAQKIFGFPWVAGVFIGSDFITVTKQDWVEWDMIAQPLAGLLTEHLEQNLPIVMAADPSEATSSKEDSEDDLPVVKQIKEFLDTQVRPAVAMDGGDIQFYKYEDHVLYLRMQGACSGCPSATMTLKSGIESRIIELIPEIKEVVSL